MAVEIKRFLDFVEIQTKLATIFPFLVALAFVFYTTGTINVTSTLIYIVAALIVDMAITGTNQHFDTRQEEMSVPHYSDKVSAGILIVMYATASSIGLYLATLHGWTVFFAGVLCFLIGLTYTWGPMPISKSVFGELFAGFTAGFLIMFIVVSINDPAFTPVYVAVNWYEATTVSIDIDVFHLLSFGLVTLPAVFSSANILLANNICDREKDRQYRYTLTHHLGLGLALKLFGLLYLGSYLAIVVAVGLGILPWLSLITLVTVIPVYKNVQKFNAVHVKAETFVLSVQNYTLILVSLAGGIFLAGVLPW